MSKFIQLSEEINSFFLFFQFAELKKLTFGLF